MSTVRGLDELAIFGAPPAFPEPLHVGRPNVGDRDRLLQRIGAIVDSRWLTNQGPYANELERRLAELLEVRHCVVTSNATSALGLVARALGMTGEVVMPSFTFIATAQALSWIGATPVFCDIDPRTHTIDPVAAEAALTPRTRGILGVHVWGRPCRIEDLAELADSRQLPLVFDASHALGCSHRGRPIGGFGDAEVFSFHATKIVNAFEGGAVTTNDGELAERLRTMRNFGFVEYDRVADTLATNAKMTEVAAAMGITSLESLDEFIAANARNDATYCRELAGVRGVSLVSFDPSERHSHHYVVLEIDEPANPDLSRDDLVAVLQAENVLARRYFHPGCHRLGPYRGPAPHSRSRLPVTEDVCERVVTLPTGTAVDEDDIVLVCDIVRTAAEGASELRRRLADGRAAA
jgi:dTDP-4-amino-4,6-dideoxygalactose transaminase